MKPWIDNSLQKFNNIVRQNRMPHALIIYGNKNIGKLELAQEIVKSITGVDVRGDNLAIDDNNTILIRNSHYKGLVYCQKELAKTSKTQKTSQVISVNQIRALCDFLEKTSNTIQIGVINTGDDMHTSASNALLKTLEEPRSNTLIIILATSLENMPITIVSRCQKIHLTADNSAFEWVKNNIDVEISDDKLQKLFQENNNTPNIVRDKIVNGEIEQETIWKKQLVSMAINPNNINKIENTKNNELRIINCLENMLITCIKIKSSTKPTSNASVNHILENTQIEMFFELLSDVSRAKALTQTTINIALLLDNLLIVWSHITHLTTYPQVVATQ